MPDSNFKPSQFPNKLLLLIFFFSGFAGLIYESIWTHYLKLFLGHAAYAQTLVLCIFMFGMASGSWIAAKRVSNIKNFFVTYAKVELSLGIFALFFHEISLFVTNFFFDSIAPSLESPSGINVIKWSLSSLLIIPQSILIGMTFPLIANGFLNAEKGGAGNKLSLLYFSNSLGASIGVLASGFILINWLGLKGTMLFSGVINITISAIIFYFFKDFNVRKAIRQEEHKKAANHRSKKYFILACIAFFTGTASFIYEVIWIRLISLILGSATHSFELMLSSFILGLALGGFIIRKKIDKLKKPIATLANIQIFMGVAAIASLFFYNYAFEIMQATYASLTRAISAYYVYNLVSHSIALLVMLPATIFAGMTLPLITKILVETNGEESVGKVYAFNTVGSIIGVLLSIHILLPAIGAGKALFVGASIDILLGLLVMAMVKSYTRLSNFVIICLAAVFSLSILFFQATLDLNKLVSGVFRHGQISYDAKVLFYKDGKTASVSVTRMGDSISLATNGKPDASIKPAPDQSHDEPTQMLIGLIPALNLSKPSKVAVIGFGSGMTTHSVLASSQVQSVDTIEIEPAIVEGAKYFREKTWRAFDDPRSHIYYEDAKTFFSNNQKIYDMIIAEPSNPWVSGVSSLFSAEFYSRINKHLTKNGIFSQWIQVYELSPELLSTIVNTLGAKFNYYKLYQVGRSDLLVVASQQKINELNTIDTVNDIATLLKSMNINSDTDLSSLFLGDKATLQRLFLSFSNKNNSDYFPVLDQNAVKSRFLKDSSNGILTMRYSQLPLSETVFKETPHRFQQELVFNRLSKQINEAFDFFDFYLKQTHFSGDSYSYLLFIQKYNRCSKKEEKIFWQIFPDLLANINSKLPAGERKKLWPIIEQHACLIENKISDEHKKILAFYKAIANLNYLKVQELAKKQLNREMSKPIINDVVYARAWLWASYMTEDKGTPPFDIHKVKNVKSNDNWLLFLLYTLQQGAVVPLQK